LGLGVQRSLGFKGQHHIVKKQHMELLYYIGGILSVGITYAIFLLRRNQSHYHDALARLQSFQNISSIRNGDVKDKIDELTEYTKDIKSKMKKDQYSSVSETNNRIGELNKMASAMNIKITQNQKILETNISRTSTEINTMKNTLKQLGQNPDFIR
tara:strand:+ start:924 stop:1391 length:468 start_codon:yes stop_codon:yes gene_type:complete